MYRNHSENGHNNINFEDNQCVVTTTNFHQYNWIYHMEHLGNDKEHVIDICSRDIKKIKLMRDIFEMMRTDNVSILMVSSKSPEILIKTLSSCYPFIFSEIQGQFIGQTVVIGIKDFTNFLDVYQKKLPDYSVITVFDRYGVKVLYGLDVITSYEGYSRGDYHVWSDITGFSMDDVFAADFLESVAYSSPEAYGKIALQMDSEFIKSIQLSMMDTDIIVRELKLSKVNDIKNVVIDYVNHEDFPRWDLNFIIIAYLLKEKEVSCANIP